MIRHAYSSISQLKPQVCIVGSGPAGFYCAHQILKVLPSCTVDIYERLPVPFGLVRYGVAPDHPEVKNVINTFTKIGEDPRVNFYGNICLGQDVCLGDLKQAYHAVVLCYGADNDRKLNIPNENGGNIVSARSFVGWYNGLPQDANLQVNLDCEEATLLGQGNVAMDVARILLTSVDELKSTDITEHSLEALSRSRIKCVHLIGRRGPLQVAFTIKEFREMIKLNNVRTEFRTEQLAGVNEALADLQRPRKRLSELILKSASPDENKSNASKYFRPIFLRSPKEFQLDGSGHVSGVQCAVNKLEGPVEKPNAVETERRELIPCGIAFRSIGYQSVCVDPAVPFDEKSCTVVPTEDVYSAGWLATGPVGVILSTMSNAFEVGQRIGQDLMSNSGAAAKPGSGHVLNIVKNKGIPIVSWEGWKAIDAEETRLGKLKGKPREKFVSVEQMLSVSGIR
uniref:NADPH:adrenodoxin oxidoreductase, mitochondrial n=1 Tax=Cacopsylla melanoneura TaxID=428564 RepID=A0A8D8SPZ6_9HEMI